MECTLHLECTWSGVGVCFYWWVIWLSPWSGILVYTYDIRSVVGVYTPVGVATEWLWSVHSKLECTLRQGKGTVGKYYQKITILIISYSSKCCFSRLLFLYSTHCYHFPYFLLVGLLLKYVALFQSESQLSLRVIVNWCRVADLMEDG